METNIFETEKIIDVQTGEVKIGYKRCILSSAAIGSCIAIILVDYKNKLAGIAHIMLPGIAPQNANGLLTRYAFNGIIELLGGLQRLGAERESLAAVLAGGANVLADPSDTICRDNILSVKKLCASLKLEIKAQSLGGTRRRKVRVDVQRSHVLCSIGDRPEFLLWGA
ncbi:MAG: chemotaxis protein CheD [Spirochaetales bacterium]|nr:chemotaxis protein CheD [Spirochaetales bacterium]